MFWSGTKAELITVYVVGLSLVLAFILVPMLIPWFRDHTSKPDLEFIHGLIGGACVLAGGVVVIGVRAMSSTPMRWRYRIASYPGWCVVAFGVGIGAFQPMGTAWPGHIVLIIMVPSGSALCSQMIVWFVRRGSAGAAMP